MTVLSANPDWQARLRNVILHGDFLALPGLVRELIEAQKRTDEQIKALIEAQKRTDEQIQVLTEAQKRTEERLEALTARVDALAEQVQQLIEAQKHNDQRFAELIEAQKRTEERLEALTARVDALAEQVQQLIEAQKRTEERLEALTARVDALTEQVQQLIEAQKRNDQRFAEMIEVQKRNDQRFAELTEAQKRTEERLDKVEQRLERVEVRLGRLDGRLLELEYMHKVHALFAGVLRRPKEADREQLWDLLEPHLSHEEIREVMRLDLVVQGSWLGTRPKAGPSVWLAVEISVTVDRNDIARAVQRAALMRRAGLTAVPVAAGEKFTRGAQNSAQQQGVVLITDSQSLFLEEAEAHHLPSP